MREPPDDDQLVHPYLAPIAAVVGRWLGRNAFHAGAFATDAGAWALLGDSGSGKSSLIACLAARGLPTVADDLVVVEGGTVLRGPACVDLRADVARALDLGRPVGTAGGRERFRVDGPAAPAELPLRGFVLLGWDDTGPVIRSLPPIGRLPRLAAGLALAMEPPDPGALLDLATLPFVELRRPRGLAALDESVERLLESLQAA